ncbi:hypothetical protein [Staphylococcus saprophyticus]|uniref:hypothetical protein n=1 Tax=Staphylococcus saprophyticus TaxID=29385 RepID=UPI0034C680C0
MVNTPKKIIFILLTLCLLAFAIEPLADSVKPNVAFADDKKDDKKEDDKQSEDFDPTKYETDIQGGVNQNGDTTLNALEGNENDIWTNYAQIMMASAVKEENKKKAKKNEEEKNKTIKDKVTGFVTAPFNKKINGILGSGGVTFEEPFSKMASDSSKIDAGKHSAEQGYEPSGKAGQVTASYLATYNKYGYIDSKSGNSIANGVGAGATKFVRFFAGGIAILGLMMYYLINRMQDFIANTMVSINPYQLFKLSDGDAKMPSNPVTDSLNKVIDFIGFSRELTYAAMGLGITFIVMYYTLKFLVGLRRGSIHGIWGAVKEGCTRLFVIVLMLTFLSSTAYMTGVLLKGIKDKTQIGDNSIVSHLYDSKSMASGTNLSPTGGVSTDKPDAGMDKNYIDKKFDPSLSRKRIADANKNANWILHGTPKTTEGSKNLSYDLVSRYMDAGRFNVNNYIADLRRGKDQTGTGDYLPGIKTYPEDFAKKGEKASRTSLEYSMWSATQNVDKNLRKPDFDKFKPGGTTGVSPGKSTGVIDNSTFSTQSVVLMLQSSFDGENAKLNLYNLGASGEQAGMKSISTIKTEWNAVSLPGDGPIGKFASWLGMISQSVSYSLIGLAVLMAMFTTNLLVGYVLFIKQAFKTLLTGSFNSAMATFLLYAGTTFSTVVATFLPDMFNTFIQSLSAGLADHLKGFIPPSLVEIVSSLFIMYFAWMIGWKWKIQPMNETPVRIMSTILTRTAIAFESRVKELDREGGGTSFKTAAKGVYKEARTKFAEAKEGATRDVSGAIATYSNKTKDSAVGSYMGAVQGAATGAKSGNPLRTFSGGAKGAGVGAKSGYSNATADKKGKDEISSNVSQSIANSPSMAKEYEGSQARKDRKQNKTYDKRAAIRQKALDRMNGAKASDANKFTNKNLSKQLSVPVEDSARENYRHSERKYRTFKASQAAAYATDKNGNPIFKQNELRQLNDADDMEGYTNNLKATSRGNEYALTTESAKTALLNSQFLDENGEVDVEKVEKFEQALDEKQSKGQLTDEDMQQKALIDSAFVSGAQERYIEANNNEMQTAYKTPKNRPNNNSNDSTRYTTNASTEVKKNRGVSTGNKYSVPTTNDGDNIKPGKTYTTASDSSRLTPKTSINANENKTGTNNNTSQTIKKEARETGEDAIITSTTGVDMTSTRSAQGAREQAKEIKNDPVVDTKQNSTPKPKSLDNFSNTKNQQSTHRKTKVEKPNNKPNSSSQPQETTRNKQHPNNKPTHRKTKVEKPNYKPNSSSQPQETTRNKQHPNNKPTHRKTKVEKPNNKPNSSSQPQETTRNKQHPNSKPTIKRNNKKR